MVGFGEGEMEAGAFPGFAEHLRGDVVGLCGAAGLEIGCDEQGAGVEVRLEIPGAGECVGCCGGVTFLLIGLRGNL